MRWARPKHLPTPTSHVFRTPCAREGCSPHHLYYCGGGRHTIGVNGHTGHVGCLCWWATQPTRTRIQSNKFGSTHDFTHAGTAREPLEWECFFRRLAVEPNPSNDQKRAWMTDWLTAAAAPLSQTQIPLTTQTHTHWHNEKNTLAHTEHTLNTIDEKFTVKTTTAVYAVGSSPIPPLSCQFILWFFSVYWCECALEGQGQGPRVRLPTNRLWRQKKNSHGERGCSATNI